MQAGVGWPHQFGMLRLPNKELVQSNNSELRIESVLSCFEILSRGTNFKMGPRKNYKKHTTKLLSHFHERCYSVRCPLIKHDDQKEGLPPQN